MVFSYLLLKGKYLNFRFMHMLLASAETQLGDEVREVYWRGGEQTVEVEKKTSLDHSTVFLVLHR